MTEFHGVHAVEEGEGRCAGGLLRFDDILTRGTLCPDAVSPIVFRVFNEQPCVRNWFATVRTLTKRQVIGRHA